MGNKTIEELEQISLALIESNEKEFIGSNEMNLHLSEDVARMCFNECIQAKIDVIEKVIGALSNSRYGNPDNFKSYVIYLRQALIELDFQKIK